MALRTVVDMNRRLALTFAGATAAVVTVAGGAMAANVGLLSTTNEVPVGNLTAQGVEQLATRPAAEVAPATAVVPVDPAAPAAPVTAAPPATVASTSGSFGIAAIDPAIPTEPAPVITQPAPVDTVPNYDDHDDDDHDDDHYDDDDHGEHEDDDDD